MPCQNRVLPTGEVIAHPARGAFMGNRGILHDAQGLHPTRRWAHKGWVTCQLSFKGRRRFPLMRPGTYTELFFHDEAVAFAAGHRPCAECRRYRAALRFEGTAKALDDLLHAERVVPRAFRQRRHRRDIGALPDGAFLLTPEGTPAVLWQGALHPFDPGGYLPPRAVPAGQVDVLTPPTTLDAFHAGYRPLVQLRAAP